ncbi:MAG: prepilin-type N-terminal cleavage/methylation domain-containing protein [Bryobacterales bacterium]|nr:prepilin-type N-terminal cleavage/methylation domain-containing protein [Bryobacterales bacterium]
MLRAGSSRRGVTLIELMIVVMIVSLMAGVAFPIVSSGVDSLRLRGAGEEAATMLTAAVNRAERRRIAVEVAIPPAENRVILLGAEPGYHREFRAPTGIALTANAERYWIYPGGAAPRVTLLLTNTRGTRRMVRLDPITGVAESRTLDAAEVLP